MPPEATTHPTDATAQPAAVTDKASTGAQTEVQNHLAQAGNIKTDNTAANKAVDDLFGTPVIDFGDGHDKASQPQPTTEQVQTGAGHDQPSQPQPTTEQVQTGAGHDQPSQPQPTTEQVQTGDGHDKASQPQPTTEQAPTGASHDQPSQPQPTTEQVPAAVGHGQASHPQPTTDQVLTDLKDKASGVAQFTGSALEGGWNAICDLGSHVVSAAEAVANAPEQAMHAAPGLASTVGDAVASGVAAVIDHPLDAAKTAGQAILDAQAATGNAIVDAGKAVGTAIIDHPVESAVIAAAVVAEVVTLGTSTPLSVAAIAAVGTGLAAHDTWNAVGAVRRDWDNISPMFHGSTATPEQLQTAKDTVAKDTGTAVASVGSVLAGNGLVKLGTFIEGEVEATEVAHTGTEVAQTTTETARAAEAAADAGKVAGVAGDAAAVATPAATAATAEAATVATPAATAEVATVATPGATAEAGATPGATAEAGTVATPGATAEAGTVATPGATAETETEAEAAAAAAAAATTDVGTTASKASLGKIAFKTVEAVHGAFDKTATVDGLANVGGGSDETATDLRNRHSVAPTNQAPVPAPMLGF